MLTWVGVPCSWNVTTLKTAKMARKSPKTLTSCAIQRRRMDGIAKTSLKDSLAVGLAMVLGTSKRRSDHHSRLVAGAGEFAVVLGDRVPIAGGDLGRVGVADRAAAAFIQLAAQLQFERVHVADELPVHLLHQGGIPRETAGIQIAHLIDQRLQLLPGLGTILHYGANLVEEVQSLVDLALGVGRVGTLLGRHGLTGDARIAGVIGTHPVAIAIGRATGRIGTSAEAGELVAQTGKIVHGPIEFGVLGSVLSTAQGASRIAHLLTQLAQVAGEAGFGRIGELAAAQPIRAALHAGAEIVFVHAIERAPQPG